MGIQAVTLVQFNSRCYH